MRIKFKTPKGHECEGVLAVPAAQGKAPAVILLQEYWGVNAHIESIGERLAKEGFRVIAPDLYHGKITKDASEAGALMKTFDWQQALDDIAGAVAHARAHESSNGKVGVVGFCMGGALAFATACNVAGLSAVVPFYGVPDRKLADYSKVTAPILAHFSKTDPWAKVASGEAIKKELEGAGHSMELFTYDADHAFFNDTRPEVYSAECAKLAWERTVAFFHQHLG